MSNPTPKPLPLPDIHGGLIRGIVNKLVPLFRGPDIDRSNAAKMAMVAIDAYGPEDRADFVSIARIIAFSMAALQLLGTAAADEDLTMKDKTRIFGRAVALNRCADQSERAIMQRRRYRTANPRPKESAPPPNPPVKDHEYDAAAIQEAVALATGQTAALAPSASALPQPNAHTRSLRAALLSQTAMPPIPAGALNGDLTSQTRSVPPPQLNPMSSPSGLPKASPFRL